MGNIDKLVGEEAPLEVGQKINELVENFNHFNSLPIGTIIPVNASSNYVPNGCLPCDGTQYTRKQFKDFCNNYLGGKTSLLNVCTLAEYESEIATTSQCSKFGADRVTKTGFDAMATSATININYEQFRALYPDGIELKFIFNGSSWTLDGNVVNLSDYALSSTGTPKENDYFIVGYWFGYVDSFRVPLIKDTETVVTNNIDYANGIKITTCPLVATPFVAPYDGVFVFTLHENINKWAYCYINGVLSPNQFHDGEATAVPHTYHIPLSKGDSIYWDVDVTIRDGAFFPYKVETKEKLKSFVVVANGQTNQSLMDWSAWASSLQGRLDTDVNNITNIGKANITDLLSPDYSAGVEKVWGETYTAEVSGWVWYCIRYATNASSDVAANTCLYIDEVPMGVSGGQKGNAVSQNSGLFKIGKGSTYRTQNPSAGGTNGNITVVKFFPDKGVTNA